MPDLMPPMPDDDSPVAVAEQKPTEIPQRQLKEQILTRLKTAAKQAKASFDADYERICAFAYSRKIDFKDGIDPNAVPFDARLSKASQFVDVIGGLLFQKNPDYRAEPRKWAAAEAVQQAQLMEDYLNYCSTQEDDEEENKLAVIDACLSGLGVIRATWDDQKRLATAIHVPIKDYFGDPDATGERDMHMEFIRRRKPRWWLAQHMPDAKSIIAELPADARKPSDGDNRSNDFTNDYVTFFECYMDQGLHHYQEGNGLLQKNGQRLEGTEEPKKYVFTDSGKLLQETEWEVPLFRRQRWMCIKLIFKPVPGEFYPRSPIKPGLGQLEGMNYLYRAWMARMRIAAKTWMVKLEGSGMEVDSQSMDAIDGAQTQDDLYGVLTVQASMLGDQIDIKKVLQELNIDAKSEEFMAGIDYNAKEFEEATGLYNILYYGETPTQMRSAQEVKFREKTSRSRIENMADKVENWASKAAMAKAATARYLSDAEDIAPILGPERAQAWGFLMPPLAQEIARQEAQLVQMGAPPEIAHDLAELQMQQQQDQLLAQGGVNFDAWLIEADYQVVAGTTQRKDTDNEKECYEKAAVTVWPEMLSSGNPMLIALVLSGQRRQLELIGSPQEMLALVDKAIGIISMQPMLPPPGAAPDEGGANGSNRPPPPGA